MGFPGASSVGAVSVATATTLAVAGPASAGNYQIAILACSTGSETLTVPTGWTLRADLTITSPGSPDRGGTGKCWVLSQDTPSTASTTFTKSGTRRLVGQRISWSSVTSATYPSATPTAAATASNAVAAHTTAALTPAANTDAKFVGLCVVDLGPAGLVSLTPPGAPDVTVTNTVTPTPAASESQIIAVSERSVAGTASPTAQTMTFTTSDVEEAFLLPILLNGTASAAPVPVVDAGADASVVVNTSFTRTGTGSNSPTSWAWTIFSGPSGAGTTIGTAAALSWTPGTVGTYVLRLTATNAGGTSTPDEVTVTVTAAATAPTASAGADVASHTVNTAFTRTATATNGGSAITGWAWTLVSGPAGGGTAGSSLGTAAALSWTPSVVGTYVLGVTATNAIGTSARDDVTVTVVAASGGPITSVSIVQQGKVFAATTGATTDAVALPAAPAAGALVLTGTSVNKSATSLSVAAPFTERAEYINTSVSGALADATGQQSASWTKGAQQAALGIFETNVTGATFRAAVVGTNTETGSTSVAADLGAAAAPGVVFALVGVDSSWDVSLALGGTWPDGLASVTWTNGYQGLAVIQTSSADGDGVGGAAFLLAYRIVATGDPTSTTCSWAGTSNVADQAYMILSNYDASVSGGAPGGGTGTLTQQWLGLDAVAVKTSGGSAVRVAFSTSADMSSPVYSTDGTKTPDASGVTKHAMPTLLADTPYWYQVESGGGPIGTAQAFRTLPDAAGPRSFSFAFSSCRDHVDNFPSVNPTCLSDAVSRGIDFFLEIGDFHYRDINTNDQPAFRAAYDEFFTRSNIANLLKAVPTGYVWDDHDYGGDSSNGTTASRPAAQAVYRERVPHPTLPSATGLIYHTFVVGRVRFIVLDLRSARSPVGQTPDDANKTMLGAEQKTWLQNLLNTTTQPLTVIVSSVGWIGASGVDSGQDHWAYYTNERAQVGSWITANAARTKCVFISGDAHMLAYDNGTNSVAGVPAYHAAALNQSTSTKGGPYSGGSRASNNAYALMEVTDTGSQVALKYTGIYDGNVTWATHTTTVATPMNNGRFLLGAF